MPELITLGETMAVMAAKEDGALRYSRDFRLYAAGAESNTAVCVCKLGHTAGWISAVGSDALGEYVLGAIRAEGVDVSNVKTDPDRRTGLMIKETRAGETSVYYYRDGSAASRLCADDIPEDAVKSAKILHLTGITPILSAECRAACERALRLAKENGVLISFDPNVRRKLWRDDDHRVLMRKYLFSCDVALSGLDEAGYILGADRPEDIADLLREKGVRYIALKDGAKGAWCSDGEKNVFIPPEKCVPVETVGAGDAFNAGFICGALEGADISVCGRMGAIAGAMATETRGDFEGCPSRARLDARLRRAGSELKQVLKGGSTPILR